MKTIESFAETIIMGFISSVPFNDALEELRVSGGILMHERHQAPLTIEIPDQKSLRSMLGLGDDVRVLTFHLVRHGSFDLHHAGIPPCHAIRDEVVICPTGQPYFMSFGPKTTPVPMAHILQGYGRNHLADETNCTELMCGSFQVRWSPLNPLLVALPPVLKVMTSGVGANPMLTRAAEMFGHGNLSRKSRQLHRIKGAGNLLRRSHQSLSEQRNSQGTRLVPGFVGPKISTVIAHIHRDAGAPWTVAALAETIAMSPSRFAARFRQTTGQSAMSYVAGWRLNIACRLLRESASSMGSIAAQVGYDDVAAFSRAFKARVGFSPGQWRKQGHSFEQTHHG